MYQDYGTLLSALIAPVDQGHTCFDAVWQSAEGWLALRGRSVSLVDKDDLGSWPG